jgi:hypothetical protein
MEGGTNRQDQEEKSGKKAHLPTSSVGDTDYVKSYSSSRGTSRSSAISRGSAVCQLYTRVQSLDDVLVLLPWSSVLSGGLDNDSALLAWVLHD